MHFKPIKFSVNSHAVKRHSLTIKKQQQQQETTKSFPSYLGKQKRKGWKFLTIAKLQQQK